MPNVVVADEVVDSVVKEVADPVVVEEVVYEAGLEEVARMVQPDADIVDSVSSVTVDTEVTTPSTEPSVHIDGGFPEGSIDRPMLTEYADHMALRLWK